MNDDSQLDVWSHIETIRPRQRLLLLGASNLTRAFPLVVDMALTNFERPVSILAAMGFGRSYGKESSFLAKKISGIFQCGIWEALEQEKEIPLAAFVTDIGNDLAYEVPVEQIIEWVQQCLDRIQECDAQVAMTNLPLDVLRKVGEYRFRFFRTFLFPACRLDWNEMLSRSERLSERLHELAKTRNIPLFPAENAWYGWDPIHPRRSSLGLMWRELFALIDSLPSELQKSKKSIARACYLRGLRPESWSLFSISRNAEQPHGRLVDGTTISLF